MVSAACGDARDVVVGQEERPQERAVEAVAEREPRRAHAAPENASPPRRPTAPRRAGAAPCQHVDRVTPRAPPPQSPDWRPDEAGDVGLRPASAPTAATGRTPSPFSARSIDEPRHPVEHQVEVVVGDAVAFEVRRRVQEVDRVRHAVLDGELDRVHLVAERLVDRPRVAHDALAELGRQVRVVDDVAALAAGRSATGMMSVLPKVKQRTYWSKSMNSCSVMQYGAVPVVGRDQLFARRAPCRRASSRRPRTA